MLTLKASFKDQLNLNTQQYPLNKVGWTEVEALQPLMAVDLW